MTLKRVAEIAGVSIATASRVLAGKGGEHRISDATVAVVKQAAERIGFRHSHLARSLKSGQSALIGVVVPDVANPFFAAIAREITLAAESKGYSVLLADSREDDASERGHEDDVLDEQVAIPETRGEERRAGPGEETLEHEHRCAQSEDQEAAEDQGVVEARVRVAEHLPLQESVLDHVPEPRERPVEPVLPFARAKQEKLDPARGGVREEGKGREQEDREKQGSGEAEIGCLSRRDCHHNVGYRSML